MSSVYFCSTCGAPATPGMNYCKQCGGPIRQTAETAPAYKNRYESYRGVGQQYGRPTRGVAGLAWAIAVLSVGGLGVILGTSIPLLAVGMPAAVLGLIVLAALVMLGGTSFMLIKQMSRLIGHQLQPEMLPPQVSQGAPPLPPAPYPPQMATGPVGMPSVTEGTTRFFDPAAPRDRS